MVPSPNNSAVDERGPPQGLVAGFSTIEVVGAGLAAALVLAAGGFCVCQRRRKKADKYKESYKPRQLQDEDGGGVTPLALGTVSMRTSSTPSSPSSSLGVNVDGQALYAL